MKRLLREKAWNSGRVCLNLGIIRQSKNENDDETERLDNSRQMNRRILYAFKERMHRKRSDDNYNDYREDKNDKCTRGHH